MITKETYYEVQLHDLADGWTTVKMTEETLRKLQEEIADILGEKSDNISTGFATIAESIRRNDRLDVNSFEMENNKKFCPDTGIYITDNYYKFIKFLKENRAYEKYIHNRFDPEINTFYRNIIESEYSYINHAFTWNEPLEKREGYEFWLDLYYRWNGQLD